ncbi:hypothetical protein [Sporichthya sp.]|uniref:hypothetical protein n=1 Tax=Sporichthya sp. TaxID=65475 RepID=UPI001801F74B|nr:hypothetical protein [Sporichthya sp.]MBA3745622.1 hypothetical protein [Sporichthya sp.]
MRVAGFGRLGVCLAIAIVAVPTIGVSPAHACSCTLRTDEQLRQDAGAVFTGTLVNRQVQPTPTPSPDADGVAVGSPVISMFSVTRVYKGKITNPQRVLSGSEGDSCGLGLRGEGPYVVFTSRSGDAGALPGSSLCDGTRKLQADESLPFGRGRAPSKAVAAASPTPVDDGTGDTLGPTSDEDEGSGNGTAVGLGVVAVALIAGGVVLRRRGRRES